MIKTLLSLTLVTLSACSTYAPSNSPAQTATDMGSMDAALDRVDPDKSRFTGVSPEGYTLTVFATPSFVAEPYAVQSEVLDELEAAWVRASGAHHPSDVTIRVVGDY
jgi:hypothetical protein